MSRLDDISSQLENAIGSIRKIADDRHLPLLGTDIIKSPLDEDAVTKIRYEIHALLRIKQIGRKLVDIYNDNGLDFCALNTGNFLTRESADGSYTLRESIPVVELRTLFSITKMDYEKIRRGSVDFDKQSLINAVNSICNKENTLIFHDLDENSFPGILKSSPYETLEVNNIGNLIPKLLEAIDILLSRGYQDPHTILINRQLYMRIKELLPKRDGVLELLRKIENMDRLIYSDMISGMALVNTQSGNYELHIGQDVQLGYRGSDISHYNFCLFETLAFKVNRPDACIKLKVKDIGDGYSLIQP